MPEEKTPLDEYYLDRVAQEEGWTDGLKAHREDLLVHGGPDVIPQPLDPDKEMDALYPDRDERAKYKIEIRIGSKRTMDWMRARIDLWISGRVLAGGGDDHMFMCGYAGCGAPIPSENVGRTTSRTDIELLLEQKNMVEVQRVLSGHWAVCPVCAEKGINNNGKQLASPEAVGYKVDKKTGEMLSGTTNLTLTDPVTKIRYPCIKECIMVVGPPKKIADILVGYWRMLDGNADLYSKYHPQDIRDQWLRGENRQTRKDWDEEDQLVIYPVKNIIKDTSAGASLHNRFTTFLRA